jgi:uncharacterized protein YbjQ (UPF0145 family)
VHSSCSGLSVDDFLLVDDAGFVPVGVVVGGSVFHVGVQSSSPGQPRELEMMTGALYGARRSTMRQLESQAQELGANGIIDLRLEIEQEEAGSPVVQVMGYGTAICEQKGGTSNRSRGIPFSTTLSGRDFRALRQGGYLPLRLVMGSCIYQAGQTGPSPLSSLPFRGKNMEVPALTDGIYDARERALARMEHEARARNAEGIVGVQVEVRHHSAGGTYIIEFYAMGTAIITAHGSCELPTPLTAIDLRL